MRAGWYNKISRPHNRGRATEKGSQNWEPLAERRLKMNWIISKLERATLPFSLWSGGTEFHKPSLVFTQVLSVLCRTAFALLWPSLWFYYTILLYKCQEFFLRIPTFFILSFVRTVGDTITYFYPFRGCYIFSPNPLDTYILAQWVLFVKLIKF